MKTTIYLSLLLLTSIFIKSQNNYYLGISNIIVSQYNAQQIKVKAEVTGSTYGEYLSYKVDLNQNEITLSVCYNMTGAAVMTYFDNDFYINIPSAVNNYSLKVNVYYSDGIVCNYINLDDTATLNFTTPIQGTVSLGTNETNAESDIKLIPIPAKDELTILTKNKIETVAIFDASGKKLPAIFQSNKINTTMLPNGAYFMEVVTDKQRISKKFIVQK